MNTKNLSQNIAIAALTHVIDVSKPLVQLTPDGKFNARDGRPASMKGTTIDAWNMSPDIAKLLLARLHARKNDIVVDYEHQTLNSEQNGQPAPAAGWITPQNITYNPSVGLVAPVRWTQAALAHIKNDEYRYISPVIEFNPSTGDVINIAHVALTNYAAIDGMKAVSALRAKYDQNQTQNEDNTMDKAKLALLLGVAADATEEVIETALKALQADKQTLAALRADLGIKEGEDGKTAIAALKAISTPDLSKFAPLKVVEDLKTQVAELTAQANVGELDGLIADALSDGKLIAAQEDWARDLGKTNITALKGYLDKTPAIAALKGTQTKDKPPADSNSESLSEAEIEAAKLTGRTSKEFAALKTQGEQ